MATNLSLGDTVIWLRGELAEQREAVRTLHDRQLTGGRVSAKLSGLVDTVISRLWDVALAELAPREADALRGNLAIVALGSYGRRQCAPYSDVDLMLLHTSRQDSEIAAQLRPLTQGIFDVGLQLGHSVRTESEAVQLARQDPVICSSLMEARFLLGHQQIFDSFRKKFQQMVQRNSRSLSQIFLQARQTERDQYGETVYLLEPHVKRSRGGLRDLNLLGWLSFVAHGVVDPDRLLLQGALSKFDHHRLQSAREFLLRLRNEMHFAAGQTRDLLDRAEQLRVAEWHGHTHRGGLLPVEHFMRDYFRHTNHLWQMVRRREASLQVASRVTRVLDPMLSKNVDGDYRVGLRSVHATESGFVKLKRDLGEVLRFVELSARSGKPIEHAAWSTLYLSAPEFKNVTISPEVHQQFYNLLAEPRLVGGLLRTLHELGYLEILLPAMRHARCLLQFNQYHKYTVDEHCLRAVRKAAAFADRDDVLGQAYRDVPDKRALHLALLLHDLGKGFDEDHSEVGRRIAQDMCQLLHLDAQTTADIMLLVHKHLVLAHLAFRRDTSEAMLLKAFAEEIGSAERLRMLFVLTCADLQAVGPGVLNDWKVDVLADVYVRAVRMLTPEARRSSESQLQAHRQRLWDSLAPAEQADPWFQQQSQALPASFLASCTVPEAAAVLRQFRALDDSAAVVWGVYQPQTKTIQFTAGVNQGVGRGAFSSMAGALSSAGWEILAAATDVLPGNFLMLRYQVTAPRANADEKTGRPNHEGPSADCLAAITRAMEAAVDAQEAPRFPQVWGQEKAQATSQLTSLPNEVRIDNDLSADFTIVEVFTFDRAGLLYLLTRKLNNFGLLIAHAKISTYLDQVVDVFYVTDQHGNPLTEARRLEELQTELLDVVESK